MAGLDDQMNWAAADSFTGGAKSVDSVKGDDRRGNGTNEAIQVNDKITCVVNGKVYYYDHVAYTGIADGFYYIRPAINPDGNFAFKLVFGGYEEISSTVETSEYPWAAPQDMVATLTKNGRVVTVQIAELSGTSISRGKIIATIIPVGFRPSIEVRLPALVQNNSAQSIAYVTISTAGVVTFTGYVNGASYLDSGIASFKSMAASWNT